MKIQRLLSLALPLALPLSACVVVNNDTDSGTEGTTGASSSTTGTSTVAETETATTKASGTDSDSDSDSAGSGSSTADATATDPTTTATSGSTTADSDSAGTGGDAEAILESCEAACEVLLGCYPDDFESLDACVQLCVDESTPPELDAECEAATIAVNECLGASTCDDLESRDFCVPEQEAADAACGGDGECMGGGGANVDGTECELFEECVGEFNHEIFCTVDSCECFEDGEKTQECAPQMNVCADFDPSVLEAYALECCGW